MGIRIIPTSGNANINQDNKEKIMQLIGVGFNYNHALNALNNAPTFTIADDEIYTFKYGDSQFSKYQLVFKIKDLGSGTYGVGGTQLTRYDVFFIATTETILGEIEADPTTQIINLPDSFSTTVEDVWNSQPNFVVQEQSNGYRVVNITIDAVPLQYLFTGVGDTYGATSGNTSVADDFSFQSGDLNIGLQSIQAGTNITIDNTDPTNPIINAMGGSIPPDDVVTIKKVKVTITPAQMLALHTTPIEIIPAQGEGTLVNIVSGVFRLNFNSVAYNTSGMQPLSLTNPTSPNIIHARFIGNDINSSISRIGVFSTMYPNDMKENEGIILKTENAITQGDSLIDLYISYEVIAL